MFHEKYATFTPFGVAHIAAILVSLALIALLLLRLRRPLTVDRFYERAVGAVMLLTEAVFLVWQFSAFGASPEHLPLHLCTLSLYINAIALLSGRHGILRYTAFFSIAGALIALFVPMQGYTFPHFRYLHYYANHLLIILSSLYMLRELPRITERQMIAAELTLTAFAVTVVHGANLAFDTEFMFFEVGDGYFSTLISPRNLLMIAATVIVHQSFFLLYTLFYHRKNRGSRT